MVIQLPTTSNRLWIGAIWHQILYPQISPGGVHGYDQVLEQSLRRIFYAGMPDFVVAARIEGLTDIQAPHQRGLAATVLWALHAHLSPRERCLRGFAHEGFYYFCGYFVNIANRSGCVDDVVDRLCLVADQLRSAHKLLVTFGVCSRSMLATAQSLDAYQSFISSAQSAVVALRIQLHTGKGQVGLFSKTVRNETSVLPERLVERLKHVVQTGNVGAVADIWAEIAACLFGDAYIPLTTLRHMLQTLLVSMTLAAQSAGVVPEVIYELNNRYLKMLMAPYDYTQIKRILHAAVDDFTATVAQERQLVLEHPAVQAAEEYIRCHSTQQLSLSVIAQAVNLSPPYLSQLFHKSRGMTITDYINRTRIETACHLLLDPLLSIVSIAYSAGFGSVQHFNRVFRATVGCTPTDFRDIKSVHIS